MKHYDFDLFVIGAGSGGARAARVAAAQGVRVAVAEQSRVGGTCVNRGCIPKKLYAYAAEYASSFSQAGPFGWQAEETSFTWQKLQANKAAMIERSNKGIASMLEKSGVKIFYGQASLVDPHSLSIEGKTYTAERILLAPGGSPARPDIPGKEHLLTSDQIFELDHLPERILIVGGGYIACEFAGIFNALGVQTTQIYRGELFLRGFDQEIRTFMAEQMIRQGIDLRFNSELTAVNKTESGYQVQLNDGTTHECGLVCTATGRRPNIDKLNLDCCQIALNDSCAIKVDEFYQTSVPSIYAIGDVIDRIQLTPVAIAEAMTLMAHLYQGETKPLDYTLVPSAVFSHPNIACVGLTEAEAATQHLNIDIYSTVFTPLKHGLNQSGEKTLMKLIVDRSNDRVLGAHMAGEDAGETIQGIAVALKAGATKSDFDKTIGIHPTSAEEFVTLRTKTRSYTAGQLVKD
jgi:glutathione reductase (NADPH)